MGKVAKAVKAMKKAVAKVQAEPPKPDPIRVEFQKILGELRQQVADMQLRPEQAKVMNELCDRLEKF